MFENLMAAISRAHGPTTYRPSAGGRAIKAFGSVYHPRNREYRFTICDHASYGSRNTSAAPDNLGPPVGNSFTLRKPYGDREAIATVRMSGYGHRLSPVRNPPRGNWLFTVNNHRGDAVIQVSSGMMYLLFDIEQVEGTDAQKEELLKKIYEHYVLPLSTQRDNNYMGASYIGANDTPPWVGAIGTTTVEATPQATTTNPTVPLHTTNPLRRNSPRRTIPVPPPAPPPEPGRGKEWDFYDKSSLPSVPQTNSLTEVIKTFKTQKQRVAKTRLSEEEAKLSRAQNYYNEALRSLETARNALFENEARVEGLRLYVEKGTGEVDEAELMGLEAAVSSYYEKVWQVGDITYAITKPVVISWSEIPHYDSRPTKARCLAGNFLIRVTSAGEIKYWRADGRAAITQYGDKVIAPHNKNGNICWGNYRSLVFECQKNSEYAQLFILLYQHLSSATPGDNYMTIEVYAEKLGLRITLDPDEDLLAPLAEPPKSVNEVMLEQATMSTINIPVQPRVIDDRIEAAGELTAEELASMGDFTAQLEALSRAVVGSGIDVVEEEEDNDQVALERDLNRLAGNAVTITGRSPVSHSFGFNQPYVINVVVALLLYAGADTGYFPTSKI